MASPSDQAQPAAALAPRHPEDRGRQDGGAAQDGGRHDEIARQPLPLRAVGYLEDAVHYLVVVLLFGVAGIVLYRTTDTLLNSHDPFPGNVTTVINGALFVIIVMEVLRTVVAHFEKTGFQLQPFLIIGIISATREILSVGARLSLQGEGSTGALHAALLELAVNSAVVLGLATALVLVRRGGHHRETRPRSPNVPAARGTPEHEEVAGAWTPVTVSRSDRPTVSGPLSC